MNESPLRIAVVAEDMALAHLLKDAFDGAGIESDLTLKAEGTLQDGVEHLAKLRWTGAEVLLGQVGDDVAATVEVLRRVAMEAPGTTVMLAGPVLPSDALLKVMRAGAVEYLPSPVSAMDIVDAVNRVISRRAGRNVQERTDGRTFGVFGAKGGSGVTTTAVNLALELRAQTGESTILVDLDLLDGGAEVHLDLQPRYTLADLVSSFHRLDEGLLHSFVLTHSSGLDVLAAPRTALEGEKLTPDDVGQLVRVLRAHYSRVVLDVGNLLTSVALAALAETDDLALVVTPHLECLRNAKRSLSAIAQRDVRPQGRTHVVLNRYSSDPPIALEEVERALDSKVGTVLPADDTMMRRSACGGQPAALAGSSKYGKQVRSLATVLGELKSPVSSSGLVHSLLGGLFSRNSRNGNGKRPASAARRTRISAAR